MIYNQDEDDFNFLSDKRVGEKNITQEEPRRRGGSYQEKSHRDYNEEKVTYNEKEDKEKVDIFSIIIIVIAIIVVVVAVFVMINVLKGDKEDNTVPNENNTGITVNKDKNEGTSNNTNNNNSSSTYAITSVNEEYKAYPIEIKSVVHVKGGNFYNNGEKIKGDKAYVEYKQISGLKDKEKEEKINEMLKKLSVDLYDKNYLSDKDTLFVDITTKLSVNFDTLSYVVYKTGEDLDGKRVGEVIKTLNIRLDNLEEIEFKDLFVDNANIKNIYTKYSKGAIDTFYFDPQKIYIYDKNLNEDTIEMSKNYSNIGIYKRFLAKESLFSSNPTNKKVFTILDSTYSDKTTDRAFAENK